MSFGTSLEVKGLEKNTEFKKKIIKLETMKLYWGKISKLFYVLLFEYCMFSSFGTEEESRGGS